jgi:integrase
MGWQNIKGNVIEFRAAKNGSAVAIPILPDLAQALALVPHDRMIFIVGSKGLPMAPSYFGAWFREAVIAAGLDAKLTPHGLRRAFATRLADQGCNEITIMAALGDRNPEAARLYVREANAKRLVAEGMAAVAEAQARRAEA